MSNRNHITDLLAFDDLYRYLRSGNDESVLKWLTGFNMTLSTIKALVACAQHQDAPLCRAISDALVNTPSSPDGPFFSAMRVLKCLLADPSWFTKEQDAFRSAFPDQGHPFDTICVSPADFSFLVAHCPLLTNIPLSNAAVDPGANISLSSGYTLRPEYPLHLCIQLSVHGLPHKYTRHHHQSLASNVLYQAFKYTSIGCNRSVPRDRERRLNNDQTSFSDGIQTSQFDKDDALSPTASVESDTYFEPLGRQFANAPELFREILCDCLNTPITRAALIQNDLDALLPPGLVHLIEKISHATNFDSLVEFHKLLSNDSELIRQLGLDGDEAATSPGKLSILFSEIMLERAIAIQLDALCVSELNAQPEKAQATSALLKLIAQLLNKGLCNLTGNSDMPNITGAHIAADAITQLRTPGIASLIKARWTDIETFPTDQRLYFVQNIISVLPLPDAANLFIDLALDDDFACNAILCVVTHHVRGDQRYITPALQGRLVDFLYCLEEKYAAAVQGVLTNKFFPRHHTASLMHGMKAKLLDSIKSTVPEQLEQPDMSYTSANRF